MSAFRDGRVYLWRYPQASRGYRGGHLTADDHGCGELDELLARLIDRKARMVTVQVTRPSAEIVAVPNCQAGAARWTAPRTLRIRFDDGDPHEWRFNAKGEQVELTAGRTKLAELRDAVRGISEGRGDFAIGPAEDRDGSDEPDECLWIWWLPVSRRCGSDGP